MTIWGTINQGSIATALLIGLACLLPTKSTAQQQTEQVLTAPQTHDTRAIGRLNHGPTLSTTSTCTATLITPTTLLTAGHCTGAAQPTFYAGFHTDLPQTALTTTQTQMHPDRTMPLTLASVPFDLATLTLTQASTLPPIPIGPPPQIGEALTLISYRNSNLSAPTRTTCTVTNVQNQTAFLNCPVHPGMSGAPLLRQTPTGPHLTATLIASTPTGALAAIPTNWPPSNTQYFD